MWTEAHDRALSRTLAAYFGQRAIACLHWELPSQDDEAIALARIAWRYALAVK